MNDTIIKDYNSGELNGWLGYNKKTNEHFPDLVRDSFKLVSNNFSQFKILGQSKPTAGRKMMLYWVTRKLFSKDTLHYAQSIGDCVSFGAKNGTEYVQACEKLMLGEREKWRPVFPPYYYGTGRVYVGGWDNSYSDGSLGSYMATAVMKYGTLFSDEKDVPKYSGSVAKQWGAKRSILDNWKPTAIAYPVKSAALINNWDELVSAIVNGYPCPTASSIGYNMEASSDGFHKQTTNWSHQMCWIGVDETYTEPYAILLNQWGEDAHGRLKDFETGEELPGGVLRVRRKDVEKHIREKETFAYSNFQGFPEQDLDKSLFKLIGV